MDDEDTSGKVWVLLKERVPRRANVDTGRTSVMGVYASRDDLLARIERIAKRNGQYPIRSVSDNTWFIGPEEDEGFFGHSPVELRAVECSFRGITTKETS